MDLVASTFFCGLPPMHTWGENKSPGMIATWLNSLRLNSLQGVLFVDDKAAELLRDFSLHPLTLMGVNKPITNPIDSRWSVYLDFLISRPDVKRIFFTDVSDAQYLRNPFKYIQPGKIYCGSENEPLGKNPWMAERYDAVAPITPHLARVWDSYADYPLLNAGILGGETHELIPVIKEMAELIDLWKTPDNTLDMIAFNYVLYTHFKDKLVYGPPVHTDFWKWDITNPFCWIQHK